MGRNKMGIFDFLKGKKKTEEEQAVNTDIMEENKEAEE